MRYRWINASPAPGSITLPLRAPHLGSSGVVHQASYNSSIDHGRRHARHQTSLMAAACRCQSGCVGLMSSLSSISCHAPLPFPTLPCSTSQPPAHPSREGHARQSAIQTSLHVGQDKESLPGCSHWAPPLIDLLKRRPPLLLLRWATFSLSTGHRGGKRDRSLTCS